MSEREENNKEEKPEESESREMDDRDEETKDEPTEETDESELDIEIELHEVREISEPVEPSDEPSEEPDQPSYEPTPAMESTLEVELDDWDEDDEPQSQPHFDLTKMDLSEPSIPEIPHPETPERTTPVWVPMISGLIAGFIAWMLVEIYSDATIIIENRVQALICTSISGGIIAGLTYLSLLPPSFATNSSSGNPTLRMAYGLLLCVSGGLLVGLISQIIVSSFDSTIHQSVGFIFLVALFMGITGIIISLVYQYTINSDSIMYYLGGFFGGFIGILLPGLILSGYPDILRAVSIVLMVVLINFGISVARMRQVNQSAAVENPETA